MNPNFEHPALPADTVAALFGKAGAHVVVSEPCEFNLAGNIEAADYIYIGPHAFWDATGGIRIGTNVMFGPHTKIWTLNHNFYEGAEFLPYDYYDILKPVTVEDHAWVGLGAMLCPGITVGEGAIVGMGAVVTKDVPPLAIVGGNPASVIRFRDEEEFNRLKAEEKFYLKDKFKPGQTRTKVPVTWEEFSVLRKPEK